MKTTSKIKFSYFVAERYVYKMLRILFLVPWMLISSKSEGQKGENNSVQKAQNTVVPASNINSSTHETNVFDDGDFNPGSDSFEDLLANIEKDLRRLHLDSSLSATEKSSVSENLQMLEAFYRKKENTGTCMEKECSLFVLVKKSTQTMYLNIGGELIDSFVVSTGIKSHATPNLSTRPSGPMFMKYSSTKFPGGNYMGLGNMPYAVFIKGGYAIHGTTTGNFSKLGQEASHGCVRLHPDDAKYFYELVKQYGLENTWVTITE